MLKISKPDYDFLVRVFELACKREPVQGSFSFSEYNGAHVLPPTEKEGVPNCGTIACLAGGYFPLIDRDWKFDSQGRFKWRTDFHYDSPFWTRNIEIMQAMFHPGTQHFFDTEHYQNRLGLLPLGNKASKEAVLTNMKTILDNLTIV